MEKKSIENEIKKSYLEYAMSVIVSRALPDIRDGLKPVQRRILYAMNELGFTHDKPYKKSARIVGDTMGKYHPHGDTAIYDTMVRMAQSFSFRYPLIDGQGNFGSLDGDSPAAMRYTEARMAQLSEEMLEDIKKNTVSFRLNFDGSLEEPEFIPGKVPQLLINGASGIAVGMATNMMPHNLNEVSDAIMHEIDNPEASDDDLLNYVKAPDFPGGGIVFYTPELVDSYKTGRGKAIVQGEVDMSEEKYIIITSLPYTVNKALFIENVANQAKQEILKGITDIRDESSKEGMRIVIKVRDEDMKTLVLNQLYEHTQLESSIGIINLALVNNEPRILSLKSMIEFFIDHRLDMILKRSQHDLEKLEQREHVLLGLKIALDNLDAVIELIKGSKDTPTARESLTAKFDLTEVQANAILEMRLQRITALETEKVLKELEEVRKDIARLQKIVDSDRERRKLLKKELEYLKKKYGDARRTKISFREIKGRSIEELIPKEEALIVLSEGGLLKRLSPEEYRAQRRGGKGTITSTRKEDFVKTVISCSTHDYIYFFTNTGRVLKTKAYEITKKTRKTAGTVAEAILPLAESEKVTQIMKAPETKGENLILLTKNGFIKKTPARHLFEMRISGLKIIALGEDDELIAVQHTDVPSKMFVVSSAGKASLFDTKEIRSTGRSSRGVKAIRLKNRDYTISGFLVEPDSSILSVSERGIGKRTKAKEFPEHHRGTSGVYVFKENSRTGPLVKALPVSDGDEVLLVSRMEKTIRFNVGEIREQSRLTSGVKLIDLSEGDSVMSATVL